MRTTLALLALLGATGCSDSTPAADSGAHIRETAPPCTIADHATVAGCAQVVGQSFTCLPADHLPETDAGISYSETPPSSGPHWPFWEQTWGEHSDVVPRERWVHNLEHGGVILLYNCPQGCDTELAVLRQVIADRQGKRVMLTADPLLSAPRFAAVSWTWVHRTDTPDLATLLCFVDQHEGHAPEDVP